MIPKGKIMRPERYLIHVIAVVLFASIATTSGRPQKNQPVSFDGFIKEIVVASESLTPKNRIRIAVMEFTSTQDTTAVSAPFGNYFSEHLISAMSGREKFKIFERKRLDAIARELALNQTGLIDEKSAIKIGELAPIDYLLTGTFTRLKSEIEVNGRILDVVSGEIKAAFSRKIILTAELAALFPKMDEADTVQKHRQRSDNGEAEGDPCTAIISKAKSFINNNDNRALADLMTTLPFVHPCSYVHCEIAGLFIEKKFFDPAYHSFFIKEMTSSGDPDHVRAPINGALIYFAGDGEVDKQEWRSVRTMLRRTQRRADFIHTLFTGKPEAAPPEKWCRLMDDYITAGELPGSPPGASDRAAAFTFLIPDIDDTKDPHLMDYWFLHHAGKLRGADADEAIKKLFRSYRPDYIVKVDTTVYKKIMQRILFIEPLITPSEENARTAASFIDILEEASSEHIREQWTPFFRRQMDLFGDSCRTALQGQLSLLPDNRMESVIPFCLRHDIRIPGKVPTIGELTTRLADQSMKKRTEAAEILAAAGNRTASVLPQLRKALERSVVNDREMGNPNFQYALLDALANSESIDPAIHEVIISMLGQPDYTGLPEQTKKVIARMGTLLLPSLKKEFSGKKPEVQVMMIESVKMMGKRANEAKPWLKGIRASGSVDVKDAVDDALEAIGE